MNIPDGMVWASVPTVGGCLLWMAKHYIQDVSKGEKGDKGNQGNQGEPGLDMSVRNFKELADFLVVQLNGRYLLASEFREQHNSLVMKIDNIQETLRHLMR
jgi:hypothetical protein